ncbi:MAG: toll/interleukin-1 receptor domain-containing protein, partial [Planctomycetales bacterium]|nr:toll/interleukin-1 receptor domain-containing protein [Planctomycetales bacterium]
MTKSLPSLDNRQVVFVSHANPEDNAFATWLTLRLTREGYRVWCDVVKLRGGDDFWRNIEVAIRENTRRFIFVTSRASNQKPGTLQELAVAAGVARQLNEPRFIIPIKVDDLPYGEHNIQI